VGGAKTPTARRRSNGSRAVVVGFYDEALTEAEQAALPLAREIDGLDEEIAVVRLRLRSALEEHPEDLALMVKGVELLVKALSARYRLSKSEKADLSASIRGLVEEIGGRLCPEVIGDVAPDNGY
jgi:hypothetical protein